MLRRQNLISICQKINIVFVLLALVNTFGVTNVFAAEWTFMVYLDADNDLESAGIDDFMEMSSVGSDPNVNIVVQFDRIPGYNSAFGNWTIAHRFLVTPGMIPSAKNAISDWGDGSGGREVNMGASQTLIDFVEWAVDSYPATNYALVLWNHGGGWREDLMAAKPVYKAVCWDYSSGSDCLYMSEVSGALDTLDVGGKNINLLGFDACLMAMVEVAHQVKDYADVMVTSEETEPGDGWPYNTLLADLVASPTMTPSDLATSIVNRYGESYGVNSDTTQSAVDLSMMDSLSADINNFAATMDSNRSDIATARSLSQEYYYPENIDLYHFAELVSSLVSDVNIQNAAINVLTAVENAVFAEFHGKPLPNSHGLAIYFPETKSAFDSDYNGSVIDFPADTQWDEFLLWYYTPTTNGPTIYYWDGDSYESGGAIIPGATPPGNEYRNHVPLPPLVPKGDGRYYLQIRETEQEKSFIDMTRLIIIDYNYSDPNDVLTTVLPPFSAEHSVVGNVGRLVRLADDEYARMPRPGDTITLTFRPVPLQHEERDFVFVGEGFYLVPKNNDAR